MPSRQLVSAVNKAMESAKKDTLTKAELGEVGPEAEDARTELQACRDQLKREVEAEERAKGGAGCRRKLQSANQLRCLSDMLNYHVCMETCLPSKNKGFCSTYLSTALVSIKIISC